MDNKSLWSAMMPSDQLNGRGKENEAKKRKEEKREEERREEKKKTRGNKKESQFCSMEESKAFQWFCFTLQPPSQPLPPYNPCHQHWGNELRKHSLLRNCVFIFLKKF